MIDDQLISTPYHYDAVLKKSSELHFNMLSDLQTGSFLRTLCASKPNGNILELGTGTGLSLCWIAEGASKGCKIVSVDNDAHFQSVAREVFQNDSRIEFLCLDANDWLKTYSESKFDLIFADAWPGKYENLDAALNLITIGGFFLIDDLLPQPNWPDLHDLNVERLFKYLISRKDFVHTTFNWSTGLMLFTKIN
jgi:predicted O-methyltransferase YrrM